MALYFSAIKHAFNPGTPPMAVDKEARAYRESTHRNSKCNLPLY